jgi:hypothetical protein
LLGAIESGYAYVMKSLQVFTLLCIGLIATHGISADDSKWKQIDEGFQFKIPTDWKKKKVQGTDSHVGYYFGQTAYLEFDEVEGLGFTAQKSNAKVAELKRKKADSKLLSPGEEIWDIDNRLASFVKEKANPEIYGKREYKNVVRLFVPCEGKPECLSILVFFKSDKDLPKVRTIFQSLKWPNPKSPKKS